MTAGTRRPLGILVIALLSGASACCPSHRSAAYFSAHLAEAQRVLAACREEPRPAGECEEAETGLVSRGDADRLARYRAGFAR